MDAFRIYVRWIFDFNRECVKSCGCRQLSVHYKTTRCAREESIYAAFDHYKHVRGTCKTARLEQSIFEFFFANNFDTISRGVLYMSHFRNEINAPAYWLRRSQTQDNPRAHLCGDLIYGIRWKGRGIVRLRYIKRLRYDIGHLFETIELNEPVDLCFPYALAWYQFDRYDIQTDSIEIQVSEEVYDLEVKWGILRYATQMFLDRDTHRKRLQRVLQGITSGTVCQ